LGKGMQALIEANVNPMAAHSSMRNVNVQFVVEDSDYNSAICALHQALIVAKSDSKQSNKVKAA
ncbi:aspartate kinase, partial [Vibrio cincinnatiensis]